MEGVFDGFDIISAETSESGCHNGMLANHLNASCAITPTMTINLPLGDLEHEVR
jgi:hypothetical protein